jgi:exoribonuclease R
VPKTSQIVGRYFTDAGVGKVADASVGKVAANNLAGFRHQDADDARFAAALAVRAQRLIGHRDGYGFLRVEGRKDDLYLSSEQMKTCIHGDQV